MFTKIFFYTLLFTCFAFADDVFLKNGNVILNCEKSFENEYRVFVNTSDGVKIYEWDEIEFYKVAPYNPDKPTEFTKRQTLSPGATGTTGSVLESAKTPIILLSAAGVMLSIDMLVDINEFEMEDRLSARKHAVAYGVLVASGCGLVYGLLMEK